jgi:carboxyl-terminal processing protease
VAGHPPIRGVADDQGAAQAKPAAQAVDPVKVIAEVRKKLQENYVAPLDEKQLTRDAIRSLLKSLKDPYTAYLPAEELDRYESEVKGAFAGIGAQLKTVDQRVMVVTPLEDSPALKAGIRPGDVIEAIDGHKAPGDVQTAVKLILGKPGTQVKLKVVHADGVVEDLTITRAQLQLLSLHGFRRDGAGHWVYWLDPQQKIGYVQIAQFNSRTASDLRKVLQGLQKDGMKGLLLDLRFCPGGLLDQALSTCKLFLARGTILTTRGSNKEEKSWSADGKDTLGDFPLVVLLNEQTASAAEIVAGALRDHNRAVLVGSRSFGKGSVQALVALNEGGALRLTTAYHYLPSGRNIHRRPGAKTWGVDPTDGYYIPMPAMQLAALSQDAQQRALIHLKKEDQPKLPARMTPQLLEEKHADPQLAGALRTMVAKLTGGEFIKVGKSAAYLQEQMEKLETLRQRREALVRNLVELTADPGAPARLHQGRETLVRELNQLDREIADLQVITPRPPER